MKPYVIITDSCCDLGNDLREKYSIEYLKNELAFDGKTVPTDLNWSYFTPKGFYDMLRAGVVFKTAMINLDAYEEEFEKHIKAGFDIIEMVTSSALSGSINYAQVARKNMLEKYPDAKIFVIDTLRGSLGQGLLVIEAAKLKEAGKKIEEVAKWVEDNKRFVHQIGTVDTLTYLKRAGRVSGIAATMGNLMKIKPIIISDARGMNATIGKVRGRRTSLDEVIKYTIEHIINPKEQTAFLVHADCIDDALYLKEKLLNEVKVKDVYINYVGSTIGSVVGPGMLGIYFFGDEVTRIVE